MTLRASAFHRYCASAAMVVLVGCFWACSNVGQLSQPDQPPPEPAISPAFHLRQFELVEGTDIFRAELTDNYRALSSSPRTRNIGFLDPSGDVRWLLPDNDHTINEVPIVHLQDNPSRERRPPLAMVAYIRLAEGGEQTGALILFEPAGRRVITVANGVLRLCGAGIANSDQLVLVYEMPGHYVRSVFDVTTLLKREEKAIIFPKIP